MNFIISTHKQASNHFTMDFEMTLGKTKLYLSLQLMHAHQFMNIQLILYTNIQIYWKVISINTYSQSIPKDGSFSIKTVG